MKIPRFSRLSLPLQFGLFLICLLPILWSFIGFNLHRLHEQTAANSRVHVANLALAFAEEVKSSISSIDFALIDLREEWIHHPKENFVHTVERHQNFLEESVGFQVSIINAEGILIFSSSDPDAKPIDLSDREHFRAHLNRNEDQLFISKPILGRVSNRWSVQFTRPLKDRQEKFAGVIVLSVAPEYFSRFYRSLNLGQDSSVSLVRTTGELLARSPQPELALGKSIMDAPFLGTQTAESGTFEKSSEVDDILRLYGWRRLPNWPIVVLVGQSANSIYTSYYQQRRAYLLGGAGVSLVLGIVGFFLFAGLHRLQAEQQRMKVILENSHDAFVAVDSKGWITDWNSKAEDTFGWKKEEVIGKELSTVLIPEEKRAAHKTGFERFTRSGNGQLINAVIEVEALHQTGKRIPVEIALASFFDGKAYASNAFIRDITQRKQAERMNAEKTRILDETQKTLQHSQKMDALGRLTGGIAHDFNNVLQTLNAGIQFALFKINDTAVSSALEACQRAIDRGGELARQLSVFGRVQEANLTTIDLLSQIDEITPLIRGALPSNIHLTLQVDDSLWTVKIDPLQLELALLNLAINARDAMPNGGQFTLSAKNISLNHPIVELAPGDYVHLLISDTGPGMSPDVLAKALDPFFTTKPIGKGSGMGLAQVYGFAKQMGGAVHLQSQEGKGLAVSIYLPKARDTISDEEPKAVSKALENSHGTLLFVEDDPLVRQTVQPSLEAAGFKVIIADNGDQAAQLLEETANIDLVFSDIVMPGQISGVDLAEIVQRRYPNIRILLATGYSERMLESQDIRTLSKPYEIATLVSAINEELYARVI